MSCLAGAAGDAARLRGTGLAGRTTLRAVGPRAKLSRLPKALWGRLATGGVEEGPGDEGAETAAELAADACEEERSLLGGAVVPARACTDSSGCGKVAAEVSDRVEGGGLMLFCTGGWEGAEGGWEGTETAGATSDTAGTCFSKQESGGPSLGLSCILDCTVVIIHVASAAKVGCRRPDC